jgi:hypothetical protein
MLSILLVSTLSRDTVNFDFAWRHRLNGAPAPSPRAKNCTAGEIGVNYGTGGKKQAAKDVGTCCALCASDPSCGCWDLDTKDNICWTKSDCSEKKNQSDRTSALLPVSPSPPGPAPPGPTPPESMPGFDDSAWQLVDAPHDMLIHQKLDPNASNKVPH